jgi:hypothetical protein
VLEGLQAIVAHVRTTPPSEEYHSPGPLTALPNKTQIRFFRELRRSPENQQALEAMKHTLLTVVLELDHTPESPAQAAWFAHSRHFENRWFHASQQLVVFGNASACVIFNFTTYLDGNVMMRGAAELYRRSLRFEPTPAPAPTNPQFRELAWRVPVSMVTRAQEVLAPFLDDAQATFEMPGLGRRAFEDHGVAAVPVFVLALLLAARRLTGETTSIIQFLSMNKYCCMGLATVQLSTPESIRFVDAVLAGEDDSTLRLLLHQAVTSQVEKMRQARRQITWMGIYEMFLHDIGAVHRLFASGMLWATLRLLRLLGRYQPRQTRGIVISHPAIYPEVPVVGRPGVKLPYARLFGLHYQMFPDRTVMTFMPGVHWTISNREVAAELESQLRWLQTLIASENPDRRFDKAA